METLSEVLSRIRPCDTRQPYIFVSYSSADRETVWRDVLRFQQNGYNVWLDEKNLDKTKDSWKEDALRAINSRRCTLLLFYVSGSSLCSVPCLRELRETLSDRTVINHNTPVPFVAVDVEEIGNIMAFCDRIHARLQEEIEDDREFEAKAEALQSFKRDFFNGNNDRVRVHPRTEPGRKGDYYEDIQNSFPDKTHMTASSGGEAPPQPDGAEPTGGEAPPQPDRTEPTGGEAAPQAGQPDLHTVKTLGATDIKYNICTFGSAFHMGFGVPVTIEMGGVRYERKTHSTGKGRVDGLKQLYQDQGLALGDTLDARYDAAERTIHLVKLDPQ